MVIQTRCQIQRNAIVPIAGASHRVHLAINVFMAHLAVFLACQILGDTCVKLRFLPTHCALPDCTHVEQQQFAITPMTYLLGGDCKRIYHREPARTDRNGNSIFAPTPQECAPWSPQFYPLTATLRFEERALRA